MTTSSECLEVPQLKAFVRGQLAEAEAAVVETHLRECGDCSTLLKALGPDAYDTSLVNPQVHAVALETNPAADRSPSAPGETTPARGAADSSPAATFLGPPVEPDEIGRLGAYRVLRFLGRGGMGTVFHAEDVALRRPVAIKVLKHELAERGDFLERFIREARTLAAIKHEHVVTVYQAGQEGKTAYLVMEFLEGQSLAERLNGAGPLRLPEILRLGREIATGLEVVHRHGLIHRDVKPANVWLEAPAGRVKLLDFGLARPVDDGSRMTQTGMIVGTPAFMSPEQARGQEVDGRSDLFSLGCVLYCLCTGEEPFQGRDTMGVLTALAVDDPRPIEELNPAIPKRLCKLVTEMLAKKPEERPPTAKEVLARLAAIEKALADTAHTTAPSEKVPPAKAVTAKVSRRAAAGKGNTQTERLPRARKRRRQTVRLSLLLAGGVLSGVLAGGVALLAFGNPARTSRPATTPPATADRDPPMQASVPDHDPPVPPAPVDRKPLPPPPPKQPVTEYLSTWTPARAYGWPPDHPFGDGPRNGPRGGGLGGHFATLSVNGKSSPHGIGMHACPGGRIGLGYTLDRKYDTFAAEVSLNDSSSRSPLPLTFAVYGDGKLLWQSLSVMTRYDTQACKVSVKDVGLLELTVSNRDVDPAKVMGAHGVWVEPQVTRQK
jgi:serine/threonine protein kinase